MLLSHISMTGVASQSDPIRKQRFPVFCCGFCKTCMKLHVGVKRCVPPGRTPVPAALRSFGPLPRPRPAGIPVLPAPAGLRLAAPAPVPPGSGLLRGAAAEAGQRGLCVQLWHLPLQQTPGAVSSPAQDPDSEPDQTCRSDSPFHSDVPWG